MQIGKSKKRGAPKGNKNAYKHGFYGHTFSLIEASDLESALHEGLQDEIAMLRVSLRRLFSLSKEATDLEDASKILTSLSLACAQLANLLRTHKILVGESKTADDAISTAISQVILELTK